MGDLAVAVIVGRLTRDAELKYTNGGQAVCHFAVATGARVKKGDQWVEESSFWDVDLWGKRAESVNQYLVKGKLVAIQGDMRIEKWEQDGQTRSKVKITANDVQLLGGGDAQGGQGGGSGAASSAPRGAASAPASAGRPNRAPAPPPAAAQGGYGNDDIPF